MSIKQGKTSSGLPKIDGIVYVAKWKTRDQLAHLRKQKSCFRWERKGCHTKICPLLPARKPVMLNLVQEEITENENKTGGENSREISECSSSQRPEEVICEENYMNTTPFLVNALLNNMNMPISYDNNDCLCSGIIDEGLTTILNLPRTSIPPRVLETAEDSSINKPIVNSITYLSLDLDGYVTPKLWLYVVPNSSHNLILGKKWLGDQDAVIYSIEQKLELRKSGGCIFSSRKWRQNLGNIARPRCTLVKAMVAMIESVPVCKATLEDISKALRPKPKLTIGQAREHLPEQVKDFAHLFADSSGADVCHSLNKSAYAAK
ncbi:hypothetical protein K3495_g13722 [Podosphaera aphanis]|nr:hypothetical protein K3495_g13722 [Podosphaera aphanis]